jgi:hypothetical protein
VCGKLRERVDEEESDAAGVLGGLLRAVAAVEVEVGVGVIGVCSEAAGKKNEDGIDEREAGGPAGDGAGCGGPAAAAPDAALPCRLYASRSRITGAREQARCTGTSATGARAQSERRASKVEEGGKKKNAPRGLAFRSDSGAIHSVQQMNQFYKSGLDFVHDLQSPNLDRRGGRRTRAIK